VEENCFGRSRQSRHGCVSSPSLLTDLLKQLLLPKSDDKSFLARQEAARATLERHRNVKSEVTSTNATSNWLVQKMGEL